MTDTLTNEQLDRIQLEYVLKNIFTTLFDNDKKVLLKDLPTTVVGKDESGSNIHQPIELGNGGQMLNTFVEGRESFNEDCVRAVLGKYIREEVEKLHESRERKEMIYTQKLDQEVNACKKTSKGFNQTTIQPSSEYETLIRQVVATVILSMTVSTTEVRGTLAESIRNPKAKRQAV